MAKKKATKKAAPKKNSPHLLRDHPNLKWLLLIFAVLSIYAFWKANQNEQKVNEYLNQQMPMMQEVEMDTTDSAGDAEMEVEVDDSMSY